MTLFEQNTHVFIVRIWIEPREIAGAVPEWRGVIEHMPGGERRYLKNTDEISTFIVPYLERMGMQLGTLWRLKRWLSRWRLVFKARR